MNWISFKRSPVLKDHYFVQRGPLNTGLTVYSNSRVFKSTFLNNINNTNNNNDNDNNDNNNNDNNNNNKINNNNFP